MQDQDCIFCKIIAKQVPAHLVAENDDVIVINDINPKADVHYLIIPKKHTKDLQSLPAAELKTMAAVMGMAQQLPHSAYKLVMNNGYAAGQRVFHIHMHYLSGAVVGDV